MNSGLLAQGNTAKLYCLNLIDRLATEREDQLTILDLGCGTAGNFVTLLTRHPGIRYIGVEPSPGACGAAHAATKHLNAEIRNQSAYAVQVIQLTWLFPLAFLSTCTNAPATWSV
jgi:tRNA G46 methylase TrmB